MIVMFFALFPIRVEYANFISMFFLPATRAIVVASRCSHSRQYKNGPRRLQQGCRANWLVSGPHPFIKSRSNEDRRQARTGCATDAANPLLLIAVDDQLLKTSVKKVYG